MSDAPWYCSNCGAGIWSMFRIDGDILCADCFALRTEHTAEQDALTERINRLFTPKASPAQEALARLEAIADSLEASPLADLDTDSPSTVEMAKDIRKCVDALKIALR